MIPRKLILKCHLSVGDIVMLSTCPRDLSLAYPQAYQIDTRTSCPEIFAHNPYITQLQNGEGPEIEMHYPIIKEANRAALHFVHGFRLFLESVIKRPIPLTAFKGDLHLSAEELAMPRQVEQPYWIIVSGGKNDFQAKMWDPARWQQVVDHFKGRIQFAQVGEWNHFHPNLSGVIDLRGKTTLRELILLVYHCDGVLCPVTSLMHLAVAVPTKTERPRPCVVVAGSREPPGWEAYPSHRFLSNIGHTALPCSWTGGCWKSRVTKLNDGTPFDESLCLYPEMAESTLIPRCLKLITPQMVIDAVDSFIS